MKGGFSMETDKITSSYRKSIGETQTVVDVTLQKQEGGDIGKVLVSSAEPYVDEIEVLNGEATYSGNVLFKLVYVDSEGQNHTASQNVDFSGKVENDALNPLMKPIYNVEIVEVNVSDLQPETAKLSATIAVKLDVIATDEVQEIKPTDSTIQIDKELERYYSVVSSGTKTVTVSDQFETKADVQSVMLSMGNANFKMAVAGTGYFAVDGDVFVNSLLEVQTDEGKQFKNFMETLPFKEELEDENIQRDDTIVAFAFLRPQDLTVELKTPSQNQDGITQNQTISVSAIVTIKYIALRQTESDVVTDAFSMTNKTNLITESFMTAKNLKNEQFKSTIEGQTTIDDAEPRIAKVCAITNEQISIASTKVDAGKLYVEGVATATAICLTDDDVQVTNSIDLEVPFSNKFELNDDFDGNLFATAQIVDVDARARKGKEVTANFDVCFSVASYSVGTNIVLKDVELTEPIAQSEYPLQVYIAPKGSTLWDVSKQLLVSQDTLLKQNPDLVFPLQEASQIVYFRQRT